REETSRPRASGLFLLLGQEGPCAPLLRARREPGRRISYTTRVTRTGVAGHGRSARQRGVDTMEDQELEKLRHSAAHVMAEAVQSIFPEAKLGIGPAIDNGFYYDFDLPRPLTQEDLDEISERMRDSIKARKPF